MTSLDIINTTNGTLRSIGLALIAMGALEVTKGDFIGGGILLIAGLIANIVYEYFPNKPATPPTVTVTNLPPTAVPPTTP